MSQLDYIGHTNKLGFQLSDELIEYALQALNNILSNGTLGEIFFLQKETFWFVYRTRHYFKFTIDISKCGQYEPFTMISSFFFSDESSARLPDAAPCLCKILQGTK